MNTVIQDDFSNFVNDCELFNSGIILYDSKGGSLVFEGKGVYDKKPLLVENEKGQVFYQGHKSILTLAMPDLMFLTSYVSLKGYYVSITDNVETKNYNIINSEYNSNSNAIYLELKEDV